MIRKILMGCFALIALTPGTMWGQTAADQMTEIKEERAELLSEQAWMLANQKQEFAQAASYLREAAVLRDDCADKVRDLLNAGRFHFYANNSLSAVSALKDAGVVALALGDTETARRAFLDGARVAVSAGDMVTARQLVALSGPDGARVVAAYSATGVPSLN